MKIVSVLKPWPKIRKKPWQSRPAAALTQMQILPWSSRQPYPWIMIGKLWQALSPACVCKLYGGASFFPYSHQPSMDEPPSQLLRSRIPRKTIIVDRELWESFVYVSNVFGPHPRSPCRFTGYWNDQIHDLQCPLRKGIIYYQRDDTLFEHNIHSSGKHEVNSHPAHWKTRLLTTHCAFKPQIIIPKHPLHLLRRILFVLIKGNRILLVATYWGASGVYLHLSIHEISSNNRVGPTLWSFHGSVSHSNVDDLVLIKSTDNPLGISFGEKCHDHWKLFDISTTGTNASDNFALIESGRIDHDPKPKEWEQVHNNDLGLF